MARVKKAKEHKLLNKHNVGLGAGAITGSILALIISGLYMLRRSKRAEIIALWNKRWSRDTGVTEEA